MAKNNAVQIKHTKKGMKKLLRNLYLLQMNYVSVGIHKSDNKTTSGEKQKKEFKIKIPQGYEIDKEKSAF